MTSGMKYPIAWPLPHAFTHDAIRPSDDTALVGNSEEKLSRLLSEFGKGFERRKLRVENQHEKSDEELEVWKWGSIVCETKW